MYFDDIQHIPFRWRSLVKSMNVICPTDISKNSANKSPNTVLSGQLSIKDIVGTMNVSELYFFKSADTIMFNIITRLSV